jgi:hypothetical protein
MAARPMRLNPYGFGAESSAAAFLPRSHVVVKLFGFLHSLTDLLVEGSKTAHQ